MAAFICRDLSSCFSGSKLPSRMPAHRLRVTQFFTRAADQYGLIDYFVAPLRAKPDRAIYAFSDRAFCACFAKPMKWPSNTGAGSNSCLIAVNLPWKMRRYLKTAGRKKRRLFMALQETA